MMISVDELTVEEVHKAYRLGTYTCRQLVEAFLERIDTLDCHGPNINSILARSTTAVAEADALDAHFKSTSQLIGQLHGIPVVVKDQVDTKGMITTYGSIVAAENIPTEDATLIKKLKKSGAIILAKTTMPDFATSWFSCSSISGTTHNPYDLTREPGGSSSGTGAAIAANFAIIGVGEDTGGSIRLPASFCNLVGLRCTPGLVSRKGLSPLLPTQDSPGPMTRTVKDAALMLDVLVGFDIDDPYTITAAIAGTPLGGSYASGLDSTFLKQARFGVLRSQCFGPDSDPECAAVNNVINSALKLFHGAGTTLIDITIPNLAEHIRLTSTHLCCSRSDIDAFLATKPHLSTSCAQIFTSKQYHPTLDLLEGILTGLTNPADDPTYVHRLEAFGTFQRLVISIMASHKLDALVFPDVQIPAATHDDALNKRWPIRGFPTNTLLASQARLPAISVPAGFTEDGLPVGLELVGLPYQEQKLLRLAFGVEELVKGRKAPIL
ncbi:hypothetical protein B7463_g2147, partial [Scytalidium lignicola]